jgi:hypothetical protein
MGKDLVISFFDHNRQMNQVFDFGRLGLDHLMAQDIKDAFSQITGHYAARSRYQFWRCLKHFCSFLVTQGADKISIRSDYLTCYGRWLQKNSRLKKTNGSYFVIARRVCSYLAENGALDLWKNQNTLRFDFSREGKSSRQNEVSIDTLKKITHACKQEISVTFKNLSVRHHWAEHGQLPELMFEQINLKVLEELFSLEDRGVWSQLQMASIKRGRLGSSGLRAYLKYRELTINTLLPFYLLIMIAVGANPVSLMEIKLDCIEPHPTDDTLVFLSWDKQRATREQSVPTLKSGKYSVFNLVDFIVRSSAHLRPLANPADCAFLFLSRTGEKVRRLSIQGLHNALRNFREIHNLPFFTFSDIRRSVACLIDTGKPSISDTSNFLNHRSINTTALYLKGRTHARVKYERIAKYQGEMVEAAKSYGAAPVTDAYQTVFGMDCKEPLNSPIPTARKGSPCLEFLSCAVCPNALIVKDSRVGVARILKAKNSLEELKARVVADADMQLRFNSLYAPILSVIKGDIIPKISRKTIRDAEKILSDIPELPVLV